MARPLPIHRHDDRHRHAACAMTPVQIDRAARAPALTSFGTTTLAIMTCSPAHALAHVRQIAPYADATRVNAQAVALGCDLAEAEPPAIASPTRLALVDRQLKARRGAAAETTFRDDLAMPAHSGWALGRLRKVLQQESRTAEAAALQGQRAREWRSADTGLLMTSAK